MLSGKERLVNMINQTVGKKIADGSTASPQVL